VFLGERPVTNLSAKVKEGECYRIEVPDTVPLALEPVAMPLEIIYEDEALLVINKPAGLTVHPAPSTREPTLVHGLLAHCADSLSGIGGVARPGIVHRLDKETSGLILVAKTDSAHQHLSAQLKDRSLSRTYEALCWGLPTPASGTIDAPIGRHPKDRTRMAVVKRGGREARTHYQVLETFTIPTGRAAPASFVTLLRCKLESGRTHQIRVHLNHLGHGLLGDPVYGQPTEKRLHNCKFALPEEAQETLLAFTRQALHAAEIRFIHPG